MIFYVLTCACPCVVNAATAALRPGTTAGSFIRPVGCMVAPFQFSGVVGWNSGAANGGNAAPGPNNGCSLKKFVGFDIKPTSVTNWYLCFHIFFQFHIFFKH